MRARVLSARGFFLYWGAVRRLLPLLARSSTSRAARQGSLPSSKSVGRRVLSGRLWVGTGNITRRPSLRPRAK